MPANTNGSNQGQNQNQNQSQQGWRYTQPPSSGSGKPPQKPVSLGELLFAVLLFIFVPGFLKLFPAIWGISLLVRMVKGEKKTQSGSGFHSAAQEGRDGFREAASQQRHETHNAARSAPGQGAAARTSAPKTTRPADLPNWGTPLVVLGAVFTAIFSVAVISMAILYYYSYNTQGVMFSLLSCLPFLAGGVGMLWGGLNKRRRRERYLNYLSYIGANREVDLARMAASFGMPVKKLCKDLRKMLAKKILPTGYLDLAAGKLFLSEMGYRAPEPEPQAQTQTEEEREDDILRQIRQVNQDIPDQVMSAKIDRIEEITGKILAYQRAHPNREGQLRSFLNYYLPTTLKILRAYAQLDAQGIEGENISAAKARIEGMMDQVVAGFEKQLDKLFQDDAMDISSDVQVLENMLKKDGLSDDQEGMTMTF